MTASPASERFAALMAHPADVPLAEAAFLVAEHAYPALSVDGELDRIDRLAEDVATGSDVGALAQRLFGPGGFRGNRDDYYDPRNSFLSDVLDRRLGIPITLSILAIEVGQRIGVPLVAVSMPGHFLVRDEHGSGVFLDAFDGGALLDVVGCEAAFHAVHGEGAPFDPSFLAPVAGHTVIARLLANLKAIYRARGDRNALAWVVRLRTLVPGIADEERKDLAAVLASDGRFDEAANELDTLAELVGDGGDEHRQAAARLRARLN